LDRVSKKVCKVLFVNHKDHVIFVLFLGSSM
jgi:hypothetical protein